MGSSPSDKSPAGSPANDTLSNETIDHNHPLYIHSSDNLGLSLVGTIFGGTGYSDWRRSMLIALSVKNKLYFIQPDCERPPLNSPVFSQWDRCNNMVISWIHNLLSPAIRKSVLYCQLAKDVWMDLEDRYGQPSEIRIYQVKKELASISQGAMSIPEYYAKIKSVWDEYSNLTVHSESHCTCGGGKKDIQKLEENQRMYHFLMGLN
ncbi:uncharacterized protein LOC142180947 [Nicotiana tabacum]|uniref:Uncharacterized protein LOC142180947 n=1 Tax=Nicotiana tabacum TaxID=4097 RepID=A0AC58UI56_TOBAC